MRKARGQIDELKGFFHIENSLRPEVDRFTRDAAECYHERMLELAEANHLRVLFWHFYPTGFGLMVKKKGLLTETSANAPSLTNFVKLLKHAISFTHNKRTGHSGTIWKDRSKIFHVPDNVDDRYEVTAYILARSEIETGEACLNWPSSVLAAPEDRFDARRGLAELSEKARYSSSILKKLESIRSQILEECAETPNHPNRGPTPEWRPACEQGSSANSKVSAAPAEAYHAQRKRSKEHFFKMLARYKAFCKKTGFDSIPRGYSGEPELRKWAAGLRGYSRSGRLPEWKREALERTTVLEPLAARKGKPAPPNDVWFRHYNSLQTFHEAHGHCRVKRRDPVNKKLGNWVWTQRSIARKNKLHPEKRQLLDKLGFDWNPRK